MFGYPGALKVMCRRSAFIVPLIFLLILLCCWFFYLYDTAPQLRLPSDECDYISRGLFFSEEFSLQNRSYYFASLIEQDPPLQGPHNPGFSILLGMYIRVFGYEETNIVFLNFTLLTALIFGYFFFNVVYLKKKAAGVVGLLLLICVPLVNLYATIIMAETAVLVFTFFLIWLMFFCRPAKHKYLYYFGVFLFFWGCYLLRENTVFLLPIFFVHRLRKTSFREVLGLALLCALFVPAVYWLTRNKIQYTPAFMYQLLHETDGLLPMIKMISGNFIRNVRLTYSHFPHAMYNWSKVTFYLLTILGVLSYPALNEKEKAVYRVIIPFFLINTVMLFCFYDNYSFRGLRASIQFVPFFVLFPVNSMFNVLKGKRWLGKTVSVLLLVVVCATFIRASDTVIRYRRAKGQLTGPQKMLTHLYGKYLGERKSLTILTDIWFYRALLDYPESVFVFARDKDLNSRTVGIVNAKMHFDYVFNKSTNPNVFTQCGFKLLERTPLGNIYGSPKVPDH